ncbi:MAG: hypothetical protein AB4911_20520 [Oscillochloridaceae bacterium umkhey_bin13]
MNSAIRSLYLWPGNPHRWLLLLISTLISILLALFLAVPIAYADSPFNDITHPRPQGGGAGSVTPAELPALPSRFAELPPPLLLAARSRAEVPYAAPQQQQGPQTDPNNPLAWIGLGLNPGKWLLDSVLGAATGMIYSITSVFEVLARFGNGQIVDLNGQITSASNATFGFLFTTPEALTVSWAGASGLGSPQALHDIMRQAALSILVVICTYRALFVLTSGAFRDGLVDLLIAFFGGLLGIQGAWWFCTLFVRAANLITAQMLSVAFGGGLGNWIPLDPQNYFWSSLSSIQGVSLAIALVTILYWGTLALLAVHALVRIVMVNLMLIVSPLAGLALATGGGWNYARVWFFRFVELLATPLIWGLTLGFGRALMTGFGVDTQPILGPILAVITMLMVFKAPRMLGLAAQEAVTGARSLWRMTERAAFAGMMGGGAAGAAAGAAAAGSSGNAPTIYVDMRNAGVVDGQYRQEWDGSSFGAATSRAALPPASAPQIIDGDK